MLDRSAVPFAALAFLAIAAEGNAQTVSFPAGHVVVNSRDSSTLREYLIDGTFVREFGFDTDLSEAEAIVFGPNGVAYASVFNPAKILMYDGGGAQIHEIIDPDLASGRGLALSSRGIYATSSDSDRIVEFDLDGSKLRTFGASTALDGPLGIAVGAGGHIFAGSVTNQVVHEFDVDGGWLRSFGAVNSPLCTGLNIGPDGLLWVASYDDGSIMRFNASGQKVAENLVGSTPQFFGFGPDGNLMIANGSEVKLFDSQGNTAHSFGSGTPHGGAIVPFRFGVTLSGIITETDLPARKVKLKKNLVLTYWPAQGTAALSIEAFTLADFTPQLVDVSDLLQTETLIFHGDESRASASAKGRTYAGTYIPRRTMDNGVASISLGVTGKMQLGYWRPTKAAGAFTYSRNGKVFRGTLKTGKLLNP